MKDIGTLLERCRLLGATLTPLGGRLRVQAPKPLPDDVMADLREAKPQVLAELRHQLQQKTKYWLLEEWRKTSLPAWRRILQESIGGKDRSREEYARWMLREVLEDPEYQDPEL